jgi:hypothetical protein
MHAQSFKNKCGARKKKKNKSRRRESIDRRADGMMVFFFHCKTEQAGYPVSLGFRLFSTASPEILPAHWLETADDAARNR